MSVSGLANAYSWIKGVTLLENAADRAFPLKQVGNKREWIATLCPSFEFSVSRNDHLRIPPDSAGIYRYMDDNKIVYIGKGVIRSRYNETGRSDWQFDLIQFFCNKRRTRAVQMVILLNQ